MQLWLIPILPLIGFLINGIFGRRFSKGLVSSIGVGSVVLSFAWVLKTVFGVHEPVTEHYFTWIASGTLDIGVDFTVDELTKVMLMVVTGIGSLIHIYSIGTWHMRAGTTGSSPT
jgi:NADH-quinone oxidoreductase subunit L